MLKFRLLLLWVGILGVLLGSSESYNGDPYLQSQYSSNNYAKPTNNYGSNYAANCAYMKVLEVLDQIFCQHGERRRYSSTIYPSLELLIDQLEYISNVVYIPNVFQYLETAIAGLKTLQDATQSTYGDSSLLQPYIFFFAGIQEKGVESLGAFAGPNRAAVTEKLNACKSKLETHENQMKTFTNQQAAPAEAIPTIDEATPADQPAKRMALVKPATEKFIKTRMTRGTEVSDYTCALLPSIYCSEDKYDELLWNMLDRIFGAVNFLDQALWETWLYIFNLDCQYEENKWAIMEASTTYGSLITTFYSLLEIAFKIERLYEIVEIDGGSDSSSYYRAGGSNVGSMQMQMVNRRPPVMSVYGAPSAPVQGYSYNGYGPVPVQQQAYRPQRTVSVPVTIPYAQVLTVRTG